MGRKKKKGSSMAPQQQQQATTPPVVAASHPSPFAAAQHSSSTANLATADVLSVSLSTSKVSISSILSKGGGGGGGTSSSSSSSSTRYLPRVVLSEQDAAGLDVLADEDVIVLGGRRDNDDVNSATVDRSLSGVLICKALISSKPLSSSIQSLSYSSPSASGKKKKSQSVAAGSIQIHPSNMVDLLLPAQSHDDDEPSPVRSEPPLDATTTATPPATPAATKKQTTVVVTTPSSAKSTSSSFSFKIGGGGDALYTTTPSSSSSSAIRKQPKTPSSSASSVMNSSTTKDRFFWILPLESRLGSLVTQRVVVTNNNPSLLFRIHLQPLSSTNVSDDDDDDSSTNNNITSTSSSKKIILERILLATYVGRYIQPNEILCVTFQGKLLQLRVISVESSDNEKIRISTNRSGDDSEDDDSDKLREEFEKLLLDDDDDDDDEPLSSSKAKNLVEQLTCCRTSKLYKVTYATQISISTRSPTASSKITKKSEDNDAPMTPTQQDPVQCVVGLSCVLKQVRDLLWTPLTRPELFSQQQQRQGAAAAAAAIKPPRGILLHGPSGVGKSCLARQIAMELESSSSSSSALRDCEVQFVNCILLQSQTAIVGQAERRLQSYFQPSKRGGPKLLIFDDIHLICPRRGGGGGGGGGVFTDQLASTLLALMDGIETSSASGTKNVSTKKSPAAPIVILAVTSNPSLLDPALRRPGRLDVEVEVPIPDEPSTRADILRFHVQQNTTSGSLANTDLTTQEDWLKLAKLAKGFTGADCMLAVKEAMRTALFRKLNSGQSTSPEGSPAAAIDLSIQDLASAIRRTKPSSIKSITVEIPRVPWSSIGGMGKVKRELREAIELPLTHGDLFQQLGVPPPRGILLYGPPGCSKTLMARALATEGHMNFLSVKGPELLSKWLGESERALASLFRRARMASPSIIFFDEIDAIASARGSGDSAGGGGRLLSQLLTELDGVVYTNNGAKGRGKSNRVVVVGATNRPDLLDRALTRPGRIDRMIYVGVPDVESRRQIFKVALRDKSYDSDIDFEYLARDEMSQGFSGAEIVAICQDAALFALEETDNSAEDLKITPKVSMRHLLRATNGMQRQITPEMLDCYNSYQNNTASANF